MPGFLDRDRASRLMRQDRLDALVLAGPEAFTYAIGAGPGVAAGWRRLGSGIVVVPADPAGPMAAVVCDLFADMIRSASGLVDLRSHPIWPEASSVLDRLPSEDAAAALVVAADRARGRPEGFARPATFSREAALGHLADILAERGLARARIGVDLESVPANDLPALQAALPDCALVDASLLLARLRAVKAPGEIARLRSAAAITEAALGRLLAQARAGQTRAALGRLFRDLVEDEVAGRRETLPTTCWEYVGFGPRPWSSAGTLAPGDVLKCDVGAVVGGYSADLARTVSIGPPARHAREVHAALLDGFRAGRAQFGPGRPLADIHAAAQTAVRAHGFATYSRGHFGHGLGASIWSEEWPYIAAQSADVLAEPGMVLAFELPYYIDGIGGFIIEDMMLITETGAECLTPALPHDFAAIG